MASKARVKRFEVSRVRAGREDVWSVGHLGWTWKLYAANGEFLCDPSQNFETRAGMMKNLRLVRETDVDTPVIEVPWVEPPAEGPKVDAPAPEVAAVAAEAPPAAPAV